MLAHTLQPSRQAVVAVYCGTSANCSGSIPTLYQSRGGLNSGLSAHLVDPLVAWPELMRNHKRDHLLVFLTPHVVRTRDDLRSLARLAELVGTSPESTPDARTVSTGEARHPQLESGRGAALSRKA